MYIVHDVCVFVKLKIKLYKVLVRAIVLYSCGAKTSTKSAKKD